MLSAVFLLLEEGNFQIADNAIAIMIYRIVHTGANTQFGGLNQGLFKTTYHVSIFCAVAIPAIAPADKVMSKENTSFTV